jgi:hypothetical protein
LELGRDAGGVLNGAVPLIELVNEYESSHSGDDSPVFLLPCDGVCVRVCVCVWGGGGGGAV